MDRAKTPTPSCRRRKSERKRELYLFYSVSTRVHPKDGRLLYRRTRKIFFFLFSFEERIDGRDGKELVKKFWKWINIEFLIAMLLMDDEVFREMINSILKNRAMSIF